MLKKHLVHAVSEDTGLSQVKVREVFRSVVRAAAESLRDRQEIMLFGLGKLYVRQRVARPARNIRTGEALMAPAQNVVALRPSVTLSKAANGR